MFDQTYTPSGSEFQLHIRGGTGDLTVRGTGETAVRVQGDVIDPQWDAAANTLTLELEDDLTLDIPRELTVRVSGEPEKLATRTLGVKLELEPGLLETGEGAIIEVRPLLVAGGKEVGFAGVAVSKGTAILFHRIGAEEIVEEVPEAEVVEEPEVIERGKKEEEEAEKKKK